jgi:uncharacterized protein with LGFP repeats
MYCGLTNDGCFQMFAKGALMYSPSSGAHPSLSGPIRNLWEKQGFENGGLGYPTSTVLCGLRNSGCFQNYLGGSVMWSQATGAQAIQFGPIRDVWVNSGFENGSLGYPTSARICGLRDGGCFQNFEKGTVMWSPQTGAQPLLSGPIQQAWARQGFENGALGYPTTPQSCSSNGQSCSQAFQGGRVEWTSTGGTKIRA